jgi:PAS domain S-box-containing protein
MLYAEIFQQSTDAIFVVDAVTTLTIDCNHRAVELFEAESKTQLLNIAGHSLQKTPFSPNELRDIQTTLNTQGIWEKEVEYVTLQGRQFWGELVAKQVQIDGQAINVVWVSDISDRKVAEQRLAHYNQQLAQEVTQQSVALQTRETQFQAIFANFPVGIAVVTPPHYTFSLVNPALTELLGYSPQDLATLSIRDLSIPDDDDREWALLQDCVRGDRNTYHLEKRYRRRNGQPLWVNVNTAIVRDDHGQIQCGMTMVQDITARKLAEQALEASEARYRLLAENMTDLVCLHQPTGEYLYVSPSCQTLLGYGSDDMIGQNPYDFFHPDDCERIRQHAHYNALVNIPTPIIYRMRHQDGRYIWLETLTIPIAGDNGQVVRLQTTSRDVSDRVQVQLQLEHDSVHDTLTGLPNRTLLIERLELALSRAKRYPDLHFAVLFVDLDRF